MWKGPSTHLKSIYAPCLQILLNQTIEVILTEMLKVLNDAFILENQKASSSVMTLLSLQLSPYLDLKAFNFTLVVSLRIFSYTTAPAFETLTHLYLLTHIWLAVLFLHLVEEVDI